VGRAQEQARHELRDNGQSFEILLPARYPGEGRRAAVSVPVRRRPRGHQRDLLRLNTTSLVHLGLISPARLHEDLFVY